ncbi:MAG: hypothetical protein ACJ798_18910 [Phenylobacterium sp.]
MEIASLVAAVAAAVVATFGVYANNRQADIAAGQLRVMQQQLNDARDTADTSAVADARSVARQRRLLDTNKSLADTAAQSSLLGNRAWLSPTNAALTKIGSAPTDRGKVNIVNGGHSPAFAMQSQIFLEPISDVSLRLQNARVFNTGPPPCTKFTPSGATQVAFPSQGLSLYSKPSNTGAAVFLQACIKYITMGKPHQIEICYYAIAFDDDGKEIPIESAILHFCANHNEAD